MDNIFDEWALLNTDFEWMKQAACKGLPTDMLFFERGDGVTQTKKAMEVCSTCPVIKTCGEFAIENHIHYGFWGGMSHEMRKTHARKIGINDY